MGTFRKSLLTDATIARLYQVEGLSRYDICLRAKIHDGELVALLRRNGIPLRGDAEGRRIAAANRARYKSTLRMIALQPQLGGR